MNLHEYQSKRLFADYGIPVPVGHAARSADEAAAAAEKIGGELWVVKAQVHAGGRGKAGGVKLARTLDEVRQYADGMLGTILVTHQSGPEGMPVNIVYVEAGSEIDRELYLNMLVDREAHADGKLEQARRVIRACFDSRDHMISSNELYQIADRAKITKMTARRAIEVETIDFAIRGDGGRITGHLRQLADFDS